MNGYNPDLTNIMSYYFPSDHFTNGQGSRMRSAISFESVLQSITGDNCVRVSEVNSVCPSEIITISLTNLGGATTIWSSSSNVQIFSSNNFEAMLRIGNNASGEGWVTATLSNGIILTEEFDVGLPSSIDSFYIANASLQGSTININNDVWNYVDVWSDTNLRGCLELTN